MVTGNERHTDDVVAHRPNDVEGLTAVLDFIRVEHERPGAARAGLYLCGSEGRVALGDELLHVLSRAAEALVRGQSVSLVTRQQEISTQQAADLLGLSRPTVVKLIDDGELDARVPGTVRRKLRLADVLAYRTELHSRRTKFIADTSESRHEDVDDLLREARRAQ